MSDDAESRARERVGTVLNEKWTLERLLGVGGMAAVYAARHRNGARAAVKVLHPLLSCHKEVRERFRREGYAANLVEHPGVVRVMDDDIVPSGPDAGTAYLVMEILEGESLQERLERGPPMEEREFLALAHAVLGVLDAAHGKGVVHRDLKPENLFLVRAEGDTGSEPRVKVLDFGLARLLDGQTITSYGLALGTPSFMSPEQASGRIDEIDGRTDLFSLAATGFRLRTGQRIHEGANPVELVTKMGNLPAPRIRTVAPDVSAPFARVIDRGLEFSRDDRYASASAMRNDVRKAMTELDGVAKTWFAVPRAKPSDSTVELSEADLEPSLSPPPAPVSPSSSSSSALPVLPTARRRRRRSILPWVTLLLFGAIGGKLWLDAEGPPSDAPAASASLTASAAPAISSTPAPPSVEAPSPVAESATAVETAPPPVASAPMPTPSPAQAPPPVPSPTHASAPPPRSTPAQAPSPATHRAPKPRRHPATFMKPASH